MTWTTRSGFYFVVFLLFDCNWIPFLQAALLADDAEANGDAEASQEAAAAAAAAAEASQGAGDVTRKKISITFENYKSISNLMVMYLRRQEALDQSQSLLFHIVGLRSLM